MNVQLFLLETIFIGIFSAIIYCTLNLFFHFPIWIMLFILGIAKHLFGYYSNIQNIFCRINCKKRKSLFPNLIDYLLEGLYFLVIGEFIFTFFNFPAFISIFLCGALIHILAEILGIHKYYCIHKCI